MVLQKSLYIMDISSFLWAVESSMETNFIRSICELFPSPPIIAAVITHISVHETGYYGESMICRRFSMG